MKYPEILKYARELRKNQTSAEAFFWEKVRNRRFLGKKFTRQFIIEYEIQQNNSRFFIADFHCHEKRLIIEIDGDIHNLPDQKEYDQIREEILEEMGLTVIRFRNKEVLNDWAQVEEKLMKIFTESIV